MRNLAPYPDDPFAAFQRITQRKQNPRRAHLQSISAEIRRHYEHYSSNRYQLEVMSPHNYQGDIKEALLHCYDSDTNELELLRAEIRQQQQTLGGTSDRCQYCVINTGSTLDHYLPKEKYPEFAIYALNLVPCCGDCNNFKGTTCIINGQRQVVNFYFDRIPTTSRFLTVELEFRNNIPVPTYRIERIPELSSKLTKIINNHFQLLQLNTRYRAYTSEIVSEIIVSIDRNNLVEDTTSIIDLLHDEADKDRRLFGPNYWRAVFKDALAESTHFITITIPAAVRGELFRFVE